MTETVVIIVWWVAFCGSHILLSADAVRPRLARALGEKPFMALYSLVSLATFVPLLWTYLGARHLGPQLWYQPPGSKLAATAIMALAFALLGLALLSPAPSSLIHHRSRPARAAGVTRVTRHPLSAAFFLMGLAHCLVMGFASDLAFFGGLCLFAVLTTWHQDARKMDQIADYDRFQAETSFLPFLAMALGRQPVIAALGELRWAGVILGAVVFVGLFLGHGWMFGVALF